MHRLESESSFKNFPGVFTYKNGLIEPLNMVVGLPWRIQNRLLLHEIGACEMLTVIMDPNPCCMNNEDFREIAVVASKINKKIGLPVRVNDLVVRTRDVSASARIAGSNPILQILDVNTDNPRFIQMSSPTDPRKEYASFEDWHNDLKVPMYCMIHEDNPVEQMKSIHGRIMRLSHDGSWEVSLGTGVLHARAIGEEGSRFVGMGGHDLHWLINNLDSGNTLGVLNASSMLDAKKLVTNFMGYEDKLSEIYTKVQKRMGENVVLEFRIYENRAGLQVYDFDKKF